MTNDITWRNDKRKLSELIPWEHNPRQLTDEQAQHLAKSLRKFGLAQPFLISPDDDIYDGHQRQALMDIMNEYGQDASIDVRVSSRLLTDDERRELVIRLHENTGGWDFDGLANLYDVEELGEWGMPEWKLPGGEANDPWAEWEGMPEFEQEDAFGAIATVKVHFATENDIQEFSQLIEQNVNVKTVYIWHPKQEKMNLKAYAVVDES